MVDVLELNSTGTSGPITVSLTKDPLINLSFNAELTTMNGRSVQNSAWTLDDSDQIVYVLTTSTAMAIGSKLSIGLTGQVTPGNPKGVLALSVAVQGNNAGEAKITNNTDSDQVNYFQR